MKTRRPRGILHLALLGVFTLTGCPQEGASKAPAPTEGTETPTESAPPSAETLAMAEKKFSTLCATCHGTSGKGDGPGSASLDPKPRDYSDAAWQDSVSDEELAKVIVEGGGAAGMSPLMPPSPDLKDKPEVVKELVKMIRSFKK